MFSIESQTVYGSCPEAIVNWVENIVHKWRVSCDTFVYCMDSAILSLCAAYCMLMINGRSEENYF